MAAPNTPAPPVTPRPELLPLQSLPWDTFESFCCELLTLLEPGIAFEHYGKRGDKQRGIDLLGHAQDGTRWAAQCKQYEDFNPRDVKKAREALAFKADKYLLLISGEAKVKVRDAIHEDPHWTLWDVRDISRKVRGLPLHKARRLVEHHFGSDWCKGFLGSSISGLFTPDDYFARQLDTKQLFHQSWSLVGRQALLDEVNGLLGAEYDAALLCGRGGIGKTKLLYEWSKRAIAREPHAQILFIDPQLPVGRDVADELPAGLCVLVVDDAHAAQNLDELLAMAHKRQQLRVLLTCRPQAQDELRSRLSRAGFDLRKTLHLEIPPLPEADVLVLARQGLGEERAHLAERLAAISADSPLATVVGARLIAEREFDPRLLPGNKEFQELLFQRFEEIIVGRVSSRVESGLCQRLLRLLSALSPFELDKDFLPQKAGEFLGIEEEDLRKALDALVDSGALLRTGNRLRMTPDLLAEQIFQKACVDSGRSTGYAEEIFGEFAGICPETLAFNLAALSWRLRETNEEPPGFLKGPWAKIKSVLKKGSSGERLFALRWVVAAAYHEPDRALDCVELLLHSLNTERADASKPLPPEIQERAFLVLRLVLDASESLAQRCLDLLWEVGRDDPRSWGRDTVHSHGVGVLSEIARFRPDLPDTRYGLVLDAVERWLGESDVFDHRHTVLSILEGPIQKRINYFSDSGAEFKFEPFFSDAEQMGPIRKRTLALVQRCALSGRPRIVKAAADCLRQALRNPSSDLGDDPRGTDQWLPEQLEIIQMLEQLAAGFQEPLFHHILVNVLFPAITEPMPASVLNRALAFVAAVPDGFPLRLVRVLCLDLLNGSSGGIPEELSVLWPPRKQFLPSVVEEFRERFPDPRIGYVHLHERISLIAQVKHIGFSAGEFLQALARFEPSYAQALCEHALTHESTLLHNFLPGMLCVLRRQAFPWFRGMVQKLMASGVPRLRELVARSYASAGMDAQQLGEVLHLEDEELHVLQELLTDPQPEIRDSAVFWLDVLGPSMDSWIVGVLTKFEIGEDGSLASNLFRPVHAVNARGGLPLEHLGTFLGKLVPLRRCPSGIIHRFLAEVADGTAPLQVLDVVLSRIQHMKMVGAEDFEPFPLERRPDFLHVLGSHENAASFLQAVLASFPGATTPQRWWLARLFNALSSDCGSPQSRAFLQEQARTGDAPSLDALGAVLSHAPVDFVLEQFDLTRCLVERASALGETCLQSFIDRLLKRALLGLGEGDWRSSVPRGKERLERARRCLRSLRLDSRAYTLYSQLCEELEAQLSV